MKFKRAFLVLCATAMFTSLSAQVTVGSNEAPIDGALLQLKDQTGITDGSANATKGLGLPRVALTAVEKLEPCAATNAANNGIHTGLTVYNTTDNSATLGTLKEGAYIWDGAMWQPFGIRSAQGFGPWYKVGSNPAVPSRFVDTDSYLDAKAVVGGKTILGNAALSVHGDVSVGNNSSVSFYEKDTNGTNKVTVKAPVNLAADRNFTLPQNAPQSGFALVTDGLGNTSWSAVNPSASTIASIANQAAHVTPVPIPINGKTGGVTSTTFFQGFESIISDAHSLFNLSTGTYTAPQGGTYLISAYIVPNAAPYANTPGYFYPVNLEVRKNCTSGDATSGTIVMDNATIRYATLGVPQLRYVINVSGILSLSPGDTLNLVVSLNSAGSAGNAPAGGSGGMNFPEQFSYATATKYKVFFSVTAL